MLTVIHGDNILTSREELTRLKRSLIGFEIREINGKTAGENEIVQALDSGSLFGDKTAVIFEQLMSRFARKNKDAENLVGKITAAAATVRVIIWEAKEIAPSLLALFQKNGKSEVKLFKIPAAVFAFLDSIRPENANTSLDLLVQTLAKDAPELVFTLFSRRIRQLIMAKDRALPASIPSWQASRLTSQAHAFTMEKLLVLYRQIREYELAWKTGLSPVFVGDFLVQIVATL